MKKSLAFAMFLILAVALTSPFSVSAKTKAGAKPGSFFYFFDKAFEKTNLFFTFSAEKKAKKELEYAEERLAEAEELKKEKEEKEILEIKKEEIKETETSEKEIEKTDNKLGEEKNEQAEIKNNQKEEQSKEPQLKKINQSSEMEKLQKEIQDLKRKVEKQSNTSSSLDLSPINVTPSNIIVCNGKNWTACPAGQNFYCPNTGDAQCLYENVGSNSTTENSYLKIEKCKAQRDQSRANLETTVQEMVDALTNNYTKLLLTSFEQYKGTLMASDFNGLIAEYRRKQTLDIKAKYDQMTNDEYSKCVNN